MGVGQNSEVYAQAFERLAALGIAEIAGVVAAGHGAAHDLAEQLGCPLFSSPEEMSADGVLDAAVLCTPPESYAETALLFLRRRIHVLCEKPVRIDAGSARRMVHAAGTSEALLAMGSQFLFVGDVIAARRLVAAGAIGEIVQAENCFSSRISNPMGRDGGVLDDDGFHSIDLMRFFLGPLVDVQIVEGPRRQGLAVEESVRLFVRNASGVMGSIELSWSVGKESDSYFTLYGTEGTLHLGWRESRYRPATSPYWTLFGTGYDQVRAFQRQIANFARAIQGEEQLQIPMDDALASIGVLQAAHEALHQSRWTPVAAGPELLRPPGMLSLLTEGCA